MTGASSLARGLLVLYGAEVLAKRLGFATFAALGRSLGPQSYGDLEFAFGVAFLLTLVLEAGIAPYAARRSAVEPGAATGLLPRVCALRGLILLAAIPIVFAVSLLLERAEARMLARLAILGLLPAPLLLPWLFQARQEMGVVGLSSVLRVAVQALVVFLCVRTSGDAPWAVAGDALGLAIVAGLHHMLARRRVPGASWRGAFSGLLPILRGSLPFAASSLAWAARWFAPLIAMGLGDLGAETGRFGAGHRLAVALHVFVWLWFFNLLPALSRAASTSPAGYLELQRRSLEPAGWAAFGAAVAAGFAARPLLTLLYGEAYAPGGGSFAILCLAVAVALLSGHWRFGLLAANAPGRDLVANLGGACFTVAAAALAAIRGRPELAAWALLGGEILTALLAVRFHRALPLTGVLRIWAGPMLASLAALTAGTVLVRWFQVPGVAVAAGVLLAFLMRAVGGWRRLAAGGACGQGGPATEKPTGGATP
jgi:O-antigen/teichoic acid export membrane protein